MAKLAANAQLGPYRVLRLLGEGGMGAVYEAEQAQIGRHVAIKVLQPEFAQNTEVQSRFLNEAKILSTLVHPSVVQISDYGTTDDGTTYLVMEYLSGESLGSRLKHYHQQGQRFPLLSSLQIGWQIADVLKVAHQKGIVHRDLKPDNLMLVADSVSTGGERVKVLDFGIAKQTSTGGAALKTNTLAVMGTPAYMSPEQCAGAGLVNDKTDVYALGCVLYQAIAGRPPFVAEGAGQLIGMHLFQNHPRIESFVPDLPPAIAQLIHLLLQKDPGQRPSMAQAATALLELLQSPLATGSSTVGIPVPPAQPSTAFDAAVPTLPAQIPLSQLSPNRHLPELSVKNKALMAGAALVAIGISLLLFFGVPHKRPVPAVTSTPSSANNPTAPKPLPPVANTEPAQPKRIYWRIETIPTNANVLDSKGNVLGTTPYYQEQIATPGETTLTLSYKGYLAQTVTVSSQTDSYTRLNLLKPAVATPPPPNKKKRELRIED